MMNPPSVHRKLLVEILDARNLLPKDGQGSASAYVVVDFDGQKRRTSTVCRNLNPVWNEAMEFQVSDPATMDYEELEIEVYNDKKLSHGNARKNHFLGRVKVFGSQFSRRGDEGLIYFQLEKKSVFSWIRGEIGLKIYYYDEILDHPPDHKTTDAPPPPPPPPPPDKEDPPPPAPPPPLQVTAPAPPPPEGGARALEVPFPTDVAMEGSHTPPMVTIEESPPPLPMPMPMPMPTEYLHHPRQAPYVPPHPFSHHPEAPPPIHPEPPPPPAEVRKMHAAARTGFTDRARVYRRPTGEDYSPRVISGRSASDLDRIPAYDLVEPMQYLFVRIVKARSLARNESPYVKIQTANHFDKSKPAIYRPGEPPMNPEWHQVFALACHSRDFSMGCSNRMFLQRCLLRFVGRHCSRFT